MDFFVISSNVLTYVSLISFGVCSWKLVSHIRYVRVFTMWMLW